VSRTGVPPHVVRSSPACDRKSTLVPKLEKLLRMLDPSGKLPIGLDPSRWVESPSRPQRQESGLVGPLPIRRPSALRSGKS
jgi:hypothetical protein